ncbi:hypothetical protein [Kordia jejudonensis]|uniref:hypothetical protein n=1 Tax=Kordia jejudonensis TaxID=1348245 RepID=UPI00062916CB|nr:hypothetical protein [Kordia jejudonensis]
MGRAITLLLIVLYGYLGHSQTTNTKIDTTETVRISNSEQVIRIKGDYLENPVLLYINGGPGDSVMTQIDKMFGKLQQDFTVVLWDQRKTGKTLHLKNLEVDLSQELF